MNRKVLLGVVVPFFFLTSCGVTREPIIVLPDFLTATLSSTNTSPPASTQTSEPQTSSVAIPPIDGVTTTQLNVRSEPSTAGETLGTVAAFSKVQIVGRESYGAWYEILYSAAPTGKGWIIASYVQADGTDQIPVVDLGSSALVVQGVNVRSGPGTDSDSLGTLVPNDVVSVSGKDSSGAWLQIVFRGGPGWVTTEFMQVHNAADLPVITNQEATITPVPQLTLPPTSEVISVQDDDSPDSPIATGILSPTTAGVLQSNGFLSQPNDPADWIQFTSSKQNVAIKMKCAGHDVQLDIYLNKLPVNERFLNCGETKLLNTQAGQVYTLKLSLNATASKLTPYSVSIKIIE